MPSRCSVVCKWESGINPCHWLCCVFAPQSDVSCLRAWTSVGYIRGCQTRLQARQWNAPGHNSFDGSSAPCPTRLVITLVVNTAREGLWVDGVGHYCNSGLPAKRSVSETSGSPARRAALAGPCCFRDCVWLLCVCCSYLALGTHLYIVTIIYCHQ